MSLTSSSAFIHPDGSRSVTPRKRQAAKPLTVTEQAVSLYVTEDKLKRDLHAGDVRVHQHGSGKHRGQYLMLRAAGGRKDARPCLASGRPEALRDYLAEQGIDLCVEHRQLGNCSRC